jgi:hypothetical protein
LIGKDALIARGYQEGFLARINPQALPSLQFMTGTLSVSHGSLQVRLNGLPGASVVVDQSFNLASWTPIQTNTLPSGGLNLTIPNGINRQYYFRARIP